MKIGETNTAPETTGISTSGAPANPVGVPTPVAEPVAMPAAAPSAPISLMKGEKVSLSKIALEKGLTGGLDNLTMGLGWDVNNFTGMAFDLDASVFMLGANDKVLNNGGFIFYNQKQDVAGSVIHLGDNRDGAGDGDDEQIKVCLSKVPAEIQKIVFTITINDAQVRGQNFGQVKNAFIRIVDDKTGNEILRYDLSEDYSTQTALVVAELYRHNGEWKFNPVGSGYPDDLLSFCNRYGVVL